MQDSEVEVFDEQDVRDAIPREVPGWALPHPKRYAQFVDWVMWSDGCDDDGNFIGWCPLHDQAKATEGASAEFNFRHGVMRCFGDEPTCHPGKRAMSLDTVIARMADGQE